MTLTKAHISNAISDQVGYPKNHSLEIVEILLEIIKKPLELSAPGRPAVRSARPTGTGRRIRPTQSVVIDVLVVEFNRRLKPGLRIYQPNPRKPPSSNSQGRRHVGNPAPERPHRLAPQLLSVLSSPIYPS